MRRHLLMTLLALSLSIPAPALAGAPLQFRGVLMSEQVRQKGRIVVTQTAISVETRRLLGRNEMIVYALDDIQDLRISVGLFRGDVRFLDRSGLEVHLELAARHTRQVKRQLRGQM